MIEYQLQPSDCIICGNNKTKTILELDFLKEYENRINLVRCSSCKLEYLNPLPAKETFKNIYNEYYYKNGYINLQTKRISQASSHLDKMQRLNASKPEKINVLDIGAGTGYFLMLAKQLNYNIYGIETSDFAREYAKENFRIDSKSCLKDLPDIMYDFITFWDVLGHINNPDIYLGYCKSHLKKSGYIIIKFPNFHSCYYRFNFLLAKYMHINTIHTPTIIWRFSCHSIKKYLSKFGLKVGKIETVCNKSKTKTQNWKINTIYSVIQLADQITNNHREIIAYARHK